MAARAIWKGILSFEGVEVPVKLYSAVEDRNIRFRLLNRKDKQPIRQLLVNPQDDAIKPYAETQRLYRSDEGAEVLVTREELENLRPEPSRTIRVLHFLPHGAIDHRWYERPYYLGPDGSEADYGALIEALQHSDTEGLAHWVMRNKEYYGALQLYRDYPILMSLRFREEVVPASELEAPTGRPLDSKELAMARQLIGMLEADFDPEAYQDEYRERVREMIDTKRKGGRIRAAAPQKKRSSDNLAEALEASLKGAGNGQEKSAKKASGKNRKAKKGRRQ